MYASLWNFRAFTERDFHRIDHLMAAMGVLVHPNYSDELANGVAVSFDPIRNRHGSYYVNTQLGEDLVTNPAAHSVPEELLLYGDGTHSVLAISNQVPRGQLLMTDGQLDQLRRHLAVIHEKFKKLYNPGPDEDFAMEIEFKITSDNVLAIKQARPWVFDVDVASDGAGDVEEPPVAITLSPSGSVEPGNEIAVTMSFSGLEFDSDSDTTDYIFRADVVDANDADADACEGDGLGVDRYMYQVDEDPEVRTGRISARCPAGGLRH